MRVLRLGIAAAVLAALPGAEPALAAGQRGAPAAGPVPDVTITLPDGTRHRLSEASGVTLFVFGARWCSPCETEVHALRRAQAGEIVLVGVNRRQTGQEFADWVRGMGFDGPFVYDGDDSLSRAFGVDALPWFVAVGPGRKLLYSSARAPDRAALSGAGAP